MHQKELKVVRFSMIVLFSSLMIVYLLLYQIKGDNIIDQLSVIKTNNYQSDISDEIDQEIENTDEINEESLLLEDSKETASIISKESDSLFDEVLDNTGSVGQDKIIVLSGTSLWYGRIESVEKLGIGYQYALKDQKEIYYVFLDPEKYKFDEIVKSLGGTTYTITTEKDIIENKLFGEKITFINLPEYKEKKVIMLIEYSKTLWLIQVDYNEYHKSKGYIQKLFIK